MCQPNWNDPSELFQDEARNIKLYWYLVYSIEEPWNIMLSERKQSQGRGRYPGEENGNPLQYSCLENSMDGGAW